MLKRVVSSKRVFSLLLVFLLLVPLQVAGAADYQRDAKGLHGMVAAATPEAARVGLDILKQGGNAVDAAVAVGFALGVLEPNASGLGGGGFMLIRFAKTGELIFLDFREKAPMKASAAMYALDAKGKPKESANKVGALAVAVPGEVAGLLTALEKYGTLDRRTVMQPAITHAEKGIRVSDVLSGLIMQNYDKLALFEESRALYLKNDLPKETGDAITNLDLARTLKRIAEKGRDGFYKGAVARRMVKAVADNGGLLTMDDLAGYRVKFREPVKGTYHDYELISAPPSSSGGTHVIQLLNIMENFDLTAMGFNSVNSWHVWAEAMKRIYADREKYMADTDFVKVPILGLTSKAYAKKVSQTINMDTATAIPSAGDPWGYESGSTTHYSVVDKAGNLVAVTKTINYFFGSGLTVPGAGILLNDEMADFDYKPGNANSIEPGKRPLSCMSPTLILKNGKPFATLGTPGGKRIITTLALIISNLVDHGMDIQQAIEAPRVNHYQDGKLKIESRLPQSVQKGLTEKGHALEVKGDFDLYFGGAQGVVVADPDKGLLHGGADPRRDGQAVGY